MYLSIDLSRSEPLHTHQYVIPYNSVKPHLTPSSPPAKCLRSIPYELRQGQGRTYIHCWRGLVRDRIANHGVYISLSSYISYAFLPLALGSDPPYRSLRMGCAESSAGALLWNTRRQEIDFDFTEVSDHRIYSNEGLILHKNLQVEEGLVCILVPLLCILSYASHLRPPFNSGFSPSGRPRGNIRPSS